MRPYPGGAITEIKMAPQSGNLPGGEVCGQGQDQSPIDIVEADSVAIPLSERPLSFVNYAGDVPVNIIDNGHTLQVVVASEMGPSDPQVVFEGETYYLVQFHYHSTSEHTIDGRYATVRGARRPPGG
jgi:carbonic anhydrase